MRCQHCYDDIREARVFDETPLFISNQTPVYRSVWLNAENRSPWCLRSLCESPTHPQLWHEVKHEPMPTV